jgi:hypothetical protein
MTVILLVEDNADDEELTPPRAQEVRQLGLYWLVLNQPAPT